MKFPDNLNHLYLTIMLHGKRLLDFKGEDLVHLFMYKTEEDKYYYRIVNNSLSTRVLYTRTTLTEFQEQFPKQLKEQEKRFQEFNAQKEYIVAIYCAESDELKINFISTTKLMELCRNSPNVRPMDGNVGCANCANVTCPLRCCARCGVVKYCSKECQSSHWRKCHKMECLPIKK